MNWAGSNAQDDLIHGGGPGTIILDGLIQ